MFSCVSNPIIWSQNYFTGIMTFEPASVCKRGRKAVDLPGLFDPDNIVQMKKGGVTISAKKLAALDCPHDIGTKFTIDINQKSKKIVLSVQG